MIFGDPGAGEFVARQENGRGPGRGTHGQAKSAGGFVRRMHIGVRPSPVTAVRTKILPQALTPGKRLALAKASAPGNTRHLLATANERAAPAAARLTRRGETT